MPDVMKDIIDEKVRFFRTFQIWPLENKFDPQGWLGNFTEAELPYALHMLNFFLYYPEHFVDELLKISFQKSYELALAISGNVLLSSQYSFLSCPFSLSDNLFISHSIP